MRYRRQFTFDDDAGRTLCLDLGRVRTAAEVWVNGAPAGVRIWSPYRFDITALVRTGENGIEVLILNTLAPYLGAQARPSISSPVDSDRDSGLRLSAGPCNRCCGERRCEFSQFGVRDGWTFCGDVCQASFRRRGDG